MRAEDSLGGHLLAHVDLLESMLAVFTSDLADTDQQHARSLQVLVFTGLLLVDLSRGSLGQVSCFRCVPLQCWLQVSASQLRSVPHQRHALLELG